MFKLFILTTALAIVTCDILHGHNVEISSPSMTSHSSNMLRIPNGNIAQISSSYNSKPISSQSKSDVRINNPNILWKHDGPIIYNSNSNGYLPSSNGFSTFSSRPAISHVTYNNGPVAYATAPIVGINEVGPSYTDHTIGSSRENTLQSHDLNNAVTHYSKAVDTRFSSVRRSDSHFTNTDPKIVTVQTSAPITYASTSSASGNPIVTKIQDPIVTYSSAPIAAHTTFAGFGTQYNW